MADNNNAKRLLCTLEILKKHSDVDHRLSQQDIIRLLWDLYEIKADRKTVKSNILNLIDWGYDINYSETVRNAGTPDENTVMSDFYMDNEFDDYELRLLIDSILFSPNITSGQSKELIAKLENQSNKFFSSHIKHIATMPSRKSENHELYLTIATIDKAISENRMIKFKHLHYDSKFNLNPARAYNVKTKTLGSVIELRVSPYQMAMCDGKYYLICHHVHDKIVHYRLDRMKDVEILQDMEAKPFKTLIGSHGQNLNLKEYMDEHIFMRAGKVERARLRITKLILDDVVDTFGKNVSVLEENGAYIDISVKASEISIMQFVKLNAPFATVVEPEYLRQEAMKMYAVGFKMHDKLSKEDSQ